MRGGADLVEPAVELADDGRERWLDFAKVVVMTGGTWGVFDDEGVSDGRRGEVGREGGKSPKGWCAVGAELVCTSAGADEKGIANVVCKYGSGSEGWLAVSRVGLFISFVGVLISEASAVLVDDKERWSWLRPRFELEERLKNSQSLRMTKQGVERRAWNEGRGVGRRMRRSFLPQLRHQGKYKEQG